MMYIRQFSYAQKIIKIQPSLPTSPNGSRIICRTPEIDKSQEVGAFLVGGGVKQPTNPAAKAHNGTWSTAVPTQKESSC